MKFKTLFILLALLIPVAAFAGPFDREFNIDVTGMAFAEAAREASQAKDGESEVGVERSNLWSDRTAPGSNSNEVEDERPSFVGIAASEPPCIVSGRCNIITGNGYEIRDRAPETRSFDARRGRE